MGHRRLHQHTVNRQAMAELLEQVRGTLKTKVHVEGKRKVALAAWAAVGIVTLLNKQQYRQAQRFLADMCTQPMEELMERCTHAYEAGAQPPKKDVSPNVKVVHDDRWERNPSH